MNQRACGFAAAQCGKAPPYHGDLLVTFSVEAAPRRNVWRRSLDSKISMFR